MFPATINFVHGEITSWADVSAEDARDVTIGALAPRIRLGREIWLVQAFQLLRQRGLPVRLSGTFDPAAINIAHYDDVRPWPGMWRNYIVSVRADRDPAFVSRLEIVQNKASLWSSRDYYIPHWPQPGLIPRDHARGNKVENLVYMGKADNLDDAFQTVDFQRSLKHAGMKLVIQENEWWDYRDADVVLAVRGGPRFYLAIKPATKLVNAWMAGCPAILSPEPGYSELRQSEADYFAATTPKQVIAALAKLRESPDVYARMVENGGVRAMAYSADSIASRWEQFLTDVVAPDFERWQSRSSESALKRKYQVGMLRRRLWGNWAVGTLQAPWKEALGRIRRAMLLPRSARST